MNVYQTQNFGLLQVHAPSVFWASFSSFIFPLFKEAELRQTQQVGEGSGKAEHSCPFNRVASLAPGSFSSRTVGICVASSACQRDFYI